MGLGGNGQAPTARGGPERRNGRLAWLRVRRLRGFSSGRASTNAHESPQGANTSADAPIPEGRKDPATLRRDAVFRRSLAVADVISAAAAIALGVAVLGDESLSPALVAAPPLIVLVSKAAGLYDRDEHLLRKTTLDEAPAVFQVVTLFTLLTWLGEELLFTDQLAKHEVLGIWLLLFTAMILARAGTRLIATRMVSPERCLLLGSSADAERLQEKLCLSDSPRAVMVGRMPLEAEGAHAREPSVLGGIETLGLVLAERDVERVVIAPGVSSSDQVLDTIRLVKSLGVKVSVLPRLFEVVGSSVEFDDLHGTTLLGVRRYGLTKSSQILKRGMDVVSASLGLMLTAPLLLLIALGVKLTSPGPVFFRQRRIGRDGREFEVIKFRTMVRDAEAEKAALRGRNEAAEGLFKIAHDPRMTPLGRFLRRSCIDELPQLLNVLRGDMSLVGPRPLVPDEDRRMEGWRRRRLHLVPGITGFWQVSGSSRIPMEEMAKMDYLYGANWSVWLDIKLLLRTIAYALRRRGL
jgi:exopolysaccharide biosynthesis polyprenyl glycosylphosphotransferase